MSTVSSTPAIDTVETKTLLARSSLKPDKQIVIVHTAVLAPSRLMSSLWKNLP